MIPDTLSRGAVKILLENKEAERGKIHLMQVYELRSANDSKGRRTMKISDGTHFIRAISPNKEIKEFDIVNVTDCRVTPIKTQMVMILDSIKTAFTGLSKIIGNPVDYSSSNPNNGKIILSIPETAKCLLEPPPKSNSIVTMATEEESKVRPISSLGLYTQDWIIKTRLAKKGEIKKYSRQKDGAPGMLLPLEFIDAEGTRIGGTVFGESAERFSRELEEGKCYLVGKASIKAANKQFSDSGNDYSLALDGNSMIQEIPEDKEIPRPSWNCTYLCDLSEIPLKAAVDVLGVARNVSAVSVVKGEIKKRCFVLYDESSSSIPVTLWRELAERDLQEGAIVCLLKVRVGEYNGRQLNSTSQSSLFIDPYHERIAKLVEWSKLNPARVVGGISRSRNQSLNIFELHSNKASIGTQEKIFNINATVLSIPIERGFFYMACSVCKKKIQEGFCPRCNLAQSSKPSYMFRLLVTDGTGSLWLSVLGEAGTAIFGRTAEEMQKIKDNSESYFKYEFQSALQKNYQFVIKAKAEDYMDKEKVRYMVLRVGKQNYKIDNQQLLSKSKLYEQLFV